MRPIVIESQARAQVHVFYQDPHWIVTRADENVTLNSFVLKSNAIEYGRAIAKQDSLVKGTVELMIHDKDNNQEFADGIWFQHGVERPDKRRKG